MHAIQYQCVIFNLHSSFRPNQKATSNYTQGPIEVVLQKNKAVLKKYFSLMASLDPCHTEYCKESVQLEALLIGRLGACNEEHDDRPTLYLAWVWGR